MAEPKKELFKISPNLLKKTQKIIEKSNISPLSQKMMNLLSKVNKNINILESLDYTYENANILKESLEERLENFQTQQKVSKSKSKTESSLDIPEKLNKEYLRTCSSLQERENILKNASEARDLASQELSQIKKYYSSLLYQEFDLRSSIDHQKFTKIKILKEFNSLSNKNAEKEIKELEDKFSFDKPSFKKPVIEEELDSPKKSLVWMFLTVLLTVILAKYSNLY